MKKNFAVPLLDAKGDECKEDGKTLTLADVAINALTQPCEGDDRISATDKINLFSLAIRLGESVKPGAQGEREFTKEELVKIKDRASKNCQILAFARLCEVIDSDEAAPPAGGAGGGNASNSASPVS